MESDISEICFVQNCPIVASDELGLLKMHLLTRKENLFNDTRIDGAFNMHWQFELDKTPPKMSGYIVQKIEYKENFYTYISDPFDANNIENYYTYWEAWEVVDDGNIYPFNNESHSEHDTWRMTPGNRNAVYGECSSGIIIVKSSARFYSDGRIFYYEKKNLNNKRPAKILEVLWKNNNHIFSRDLPSTIVEPSWWGGRASFGEKTVDNEMIVEWEVYSNRISNRSYQRSIKINQNGALLTSHQEEKSMLI
jgi:hypothetical protein